MIPEKKKENVATLVQITARHELRNDDNSLFVSQAINSFVKRSALFFERESRIREFGIQHTSPIIEAS